MPTYKNIRIKMKGGKSRMQRVQVLASGKYKFVKNLVKKVRKSSSRKSKPRKTRSKKYRSKRGGKTTTNNKKRSFTVPLAIVGPMAGTMVWAYQSHTRPVVMMRNHASAYIPFQSGLLDFQNLEKGLKPLLLGVGIHKIAKALGLNRILGSAGVPFVRI